MKQNPYEEKSGSYDSPEQLVGETPEFKYVRETLETFQGEKVVEAIERLFAEHDTDEGQDNDPDLGLVQVTDCWLKESTGKHSLHIIKKIPIARNSSSDEALNGNEGSSYRALVVNHETGKEIEFNLNANGKLESTDMYNGFNQWALTMSPDKAVERTEHKRVNGTVISETLEAAVDSKAFLDAVAEDKIEFKSV